MGRKNQGRSPDESSTSTAHLDGLNYETLGDVAVLRLANPPLNALSAQMRAALKAGFDAASKDPQIKAIVIGAAEGAFPAGADLRAQDADQEPTLSNLLQDIEKSDKLLIAALHGPVLGPGFELALACHYRAATRGAIFGCPDVTLGLVPSGGATQRLPRLIGAATALDLLLSGQTIKGAQARRLGLLDVLSKDPAETAAIALARELIASGASSRRSSEAQIMQAAGSEAIAEFRKRRKALEASKLEAPGRIIDCVEAGLLLPFEGGLAFETTAYEDTRASEQSQALRYVYQAERAAAHPKAIDLRTARPVEKIAIIGASGMGQGIALACLGAQIPCVLIEADAKIADQAKARIAQVIAKAIERGQMSEREVAERLALLTVSDDLEAARGADFGFEAVDETMGAKTNALRALQEVLGQEAVIATKSVYLDTEALANALPRPSRLTGMRLQAPAHLMRLAEISVLPTAAPDATATAIALATRLGKLAVSCSGTPGLINERLLSTYRRAALASLREGASPAQIDAAMRSFGFPIGPFQGIDNVGVDLCLSQLRAINPALEVPIIEALIAAGRKGRKVGAGFYLYEDERGAGVEDADVLERIETLRKSQGITARKIGRGEIQRRALAALINEGMAMLAEGAVPSAAEIDTAAIAGLGFARWKGGPMKAADQWGLLKVEATMRSLSAQDPALWTPHPMLRELIKNGRKFADTLSG
ncbi:MAG: enoyl-CoA hydratase-related protein [Paracoccaceae bacterium]